MNLLNKLYMLILNPIYGLTSKMGEKARNIILNICFILMTAQFFMYTTWAKLGIVYGYTELLLTNTFLLGLVIIFSIKEKLKMLENNRLLGTLWIITCLLMIGAGVHHNITPALLFFSLVMLFVFPAFYFVWNNRGDYHVLFRKVSKATVLVMVVYDLVQMTIAPMTAGYAYYGIAINPNSIGIANTAGIIAALYLIIICQKKHFILYAVVVGIGIATAFLSASRASVVAILFVLVAFLICYLRSYKERYGGDFKKTLLSLVIIVLILFASLPLCKTILLEVTPKTQQILLAESYAQDETVAPEEQSVILKKFTKGEDLATTSSGRLYIWKAYLDELNITGHERGEAGLYIESKGRYHSAHNTYLEIAYRCGIFAGLMYGFIAIYAAVYAFRFLLGKKNFDWRLSLIPMAVLAFGVLSNLERALYPLEKAHIFIFFIALTPMFVKTLKTRGE